MQIERQKRPKIISDTHVRQMRVQKIIPDAHVRQMRDQMIRAKAYLNLALARKKLRAMMHSTEEQLRVHKKQSTFLTQLAARSFPKGLHCLPVRLTAEYYALSPNEQEFPNKLKLDDPSLYHLAIFSDNILAAAVVVNSTVFHSKV